MDLRQYGALVWRWLWLLALGTVLAGATAFIVSKSMTPIYRASATLLVSQSQTPGQTDYNSLLTDERLARTYAQLLEKRPVLAEVARLLNLSYSPEQIASMISVRVVRDTQLIELSVEHDDPALARDIANTVANTFIVQNRAVALEETAAYKASLHQQLADLETQTKVTSQRIGSLAGNPGQQSEVAFLQSALAQYQATYATVLKAQQDVNLSEAKAIDGVRIAELAEAPTVPVRPQVLMNTMLATLVGLMLAAGVALLFEYLDDTVKTGYELEQSFGLTPLGNIVRFKHSGKHSGLLTQIGARSAIAEAYRVLRTNVDFARISHPGKALLITSPSPGEGKTCTAANLALVTALARRSVTLVDADMRSPSLHKIFQLENNAGLTNLLLHNDLKAEQLLKQTSIPGLRVLTSGPLPPNPSELLASPRMGEVIEDLKHSAANVIFDSPPALAVTDPVVLGSRLDGVVLIVERGRTRLGALVRTLESLERGNAPLLGVVMNKVPRKQAGGHYYQNNYPSSNGKANGSHGGDDLLPTLPKAQERG